MGLGIPSLHRAVNRGSNQEHKDRKLQNLGPLEEKGQNTKRRNKGKRDKKPMNAFPERQGKPEGIEKAKKGLPTGQAKGHEAKRQKQNKRNNHPFSSPSQTTPFRPSSASRKMNKQTSSNGTRKNAGSTGFEQQVWIKGEDEPTTPAYSCKQGEKQSLD